jgi:nucleoside-diphosphate-sugar epimerase
MDLGRRRILITGGAGVIGSYLIRRLWKQGAILVVIDKKAKPINLPESVEYIQSNLVATPIEDVISSLQPDIIFHLAATFERSEETPSFWGSNYQNNVRVTHRLLSAMAKQEVEGRFVFASSYLVYDPSIYLHADAMAPATPINEDSQKDPRNLCGAAKFFGEKEVQFYSEAHPNVRSVCARIFRVYGEGSRDVISRWIRSSIRNKPLNLFQKENEFDYIFADDVATALIKLACSSSKEMYVNVAKGEPTSIDRVIRSISEHFGNLQVKETSVEGRYEKSYADIARLKKITGWQPGTSINEGISKIIKYEGKKQ